MFCKDGLEPENILLVEEYFDLYATLSIDQSANFSEDEIKDIQEFINDSHSFEIMKNENGFWVTESVWDGELR